MFSIAYSKIYPLRLLFEDQDSEFHQLIQISTSYVRCVLISRIIISESEIISESYFIVLWEDNDFKY